MHAQYTTILQTPYNKNADDTSKFNTDEVLTLFHCSHVYENITITVLVQALLQFEDGAKTAASS